MYVGIKKVSELSLISGMIYTREPLDRETRTHYWLTVYAQDMGSVPLSSMAEIYIEIDDVNDNSPQTESPVYYATVMENSPQGTSVEWLVARDLDDVSNSQLTYDITGGNPQGFFTINRTLGTGGRRLPHPVHCSLFLFIHSFVHSLICSLVHSFVHVLVHSFVLSFVCLFLHSLLCMFVHSFVHSFDHSFVHIFCSFIRSCDCSFIRSIICLIVCSLLCFVYSFDHSFLHLFIHSCLRCGCFEF